MSEWQPMETAPRDGTWLILAVETGGDGEEALVGKWEPIYSVGTNSTYEWKCVHHPWTPDELKDDIYNHYPEGRVRQWRHLP